MNHDDILDCTIPGDEAGRLRLLDVVRNRAKGAFSMRDMPNAEKLFGRAIDLCVRKLDSGLLLESNSTTIEIGLHLLYSNRAAVRLIRKNFDSALSDCDKSLDIDCSFVKSHYRKGQALIGLDRYDEALKTCDEAIILFAANAADAKNFETLKEEAMKKQKQWEEKNKEVELTEEEKKKREEEKRREAEMYRPKKREDGGNNTTASTKKGGGSQDGSQDDDDDKKNGFRGYRRTADGKTTSYFHTDISDEARKLIGDCKPQKIETPATTSGEAASGGANNKKSVAGSAWNAGGTTFEEKNQSQWFKDKVKDTVTGNLFTACKDPSNSATENKDVKISYYVKSSSGDASIACSRGKTKYVHDVKVEVRWKFQFGAEQKWVKGVLTADPDGSGEWDFLNDVEKSNEVPKDARLIIEQAIKKPNSELQKAVVGKLKDVEEQFKKLS